MSDATLSTKVLRLQNVVATDELYDELCKSDEWIGFDKAHETQFTYFSPPALVFLFASQVFSEHEQMLAQNSFPLRSDTWAINCTG